MILSFILSLGFLYKRENTQRKNGHFTGPFFGFQDFIRFYVFKILYVFMFSRFYTFFWVLLFTHRTPPAPAPHQTHQTQHCSRLPHSFRHSTFQLHHQTTNTLFPSTSPAGNQHHRTSS